MFTRNALIALLLAVIAGFSTMLGTVLLFFTKGKNERLVSASLAFAAGVMLMFFLDLYPQSATFLKDFAGDIWGLVLRCHQSGLLRAVGQASTTKIQNMILETVNIRTSTG